MCAGMLAGSASVAAAAIPGGIAGAAAVSVKCTGLTGNETTQAISGCSGKGLSETGATGTSNGPGTGTATITWSTGNTSDETYTYKLSTGKKDKCPAPGTGYTAVGEVKEKGSVTGGNALVGSKLKGTVCVYSQTSSGDILVNGDGPQTI
jgi:hypothetical protein